jgi:hypothetical protein
LKGDDMTLKDFIKTYRGSIDRHIRSQPGMETRKLNDEERRLWILNDESLYNWARRAGVKL